MGQEISTQHGYLLREKDEDINFDEPESIVASHCGEWERDPTRQPKKEFMMLLVGSVNFLSPIVSNIVNM